MSALRKPPKRRAPEVSQQAERAANPSIEITPDRDQYKQLCRDLSTLRAGGAPSNTAAVLAAVHAAAAAKVALQ